MTTSVLSCISSDEKSSFVGTVESRSLDPNGRNPSGSGSTGGSDRYRKVENCCHLQELFSLVPRLSPCCF